MNHSLRRILAATTSFVIMGSTALTLIPRVAAPAHAVFPGYNGKIFFEGRRDVTGDAEIYSMQSDGTDVTRLTNSVGDDSQPRLSPDGQQIAFTAFRSGNYDIYTMGLDGSNQTNLTNAAGADFLGSWSPDGTRIVFSSSRDGNNEIYVMDADGGNQSRLTNNVANDYQPAWSPNGDSIYFVTNRDGTYEIYAMDVAGANLDRITTNAVREYRPSLSPDGTQIVYATWDYDGLFMVSVDGSSPQEIDVSNLIVPAASFLEQASWSPDGKSLLLTFWDDQFDNAYQFKYQIATETLTQLTFDTGIYWAGYGEWQPIPNTAPVATTDSLSVAYQTATSASVLSNDTDEETLSGSNLTITVQPSHGAASVNVAQGKIEYTPADGYSGSDSLTYRICDSFMLDQKCSTAVLGISVGAPGAPSLSVNKVDGKDVTPGGTYTSSTAKPTFSGTSSPGADIRVEIHSDPIILTTQADSSGNWSVTPTSPIPPGQHTVIISATLNGQTTTLDSFVLGIQAELPQAGASLLVIQAIGSAMVFGGYGLYVFDKRLTLRRRVRPIV